MKHYKEGDKQSIRAIIESGLKRDLHMHTCYSDGVLTPAEVIDLRMSEGYELLAITDHDGIEGSFFGNLYAEKVGISYISGIELDSVDIIGKDIHILGYGFDYEDPILKEELWNIRRNRAVRNDILMKTLNDMGYGITLDDIGNVNEGRYVGKPTFAKVLQNKGYLEKYLDAFRTIFADERIRSIKKETLASKDAIDLIHEVGGIAVLAHPMEQRRRDESFEDYLPRLYDFMDKMREYGIDGIECYHPSASEEQSEIMIEYADKYGMIITEGSDLHSPEEQRDYSRFRKA